MPGSGSAEVKDAAVELEDFSLHAEMVEQGDMVGGVSMPTIGGADGSMRAARITLIHRDDAEQRR